jgi:membrane protease YdiL (CAAX protease family)
MKTPRNLILNSFLILIITLIILVSADIVSVELFENSSLSQVFQLLFAFVFICIFSKGKIGSYGFKLPIKLSYFKLFVWIIIIHILMITPFLFYDLQGEKHPVSYMKFGEIVLITWILSPFAEEFIFRGMTQSFMYPLKHIEIKVKSVNFSYPVIFTAFLFSLAHLPLLFRGVDFVLGISILFSTFSFGILFGYIREKSGSIAPAILSHMIVNIITTFIDYIPLY